MPKYIIDCVTAIAFGVGMVPPCYCQGQHDSFVRAEALVANGRWTPTGNLNVARVGHTATLLPNGKVVVVGGLGVDPYPQNVLDTAELYDPATGTWSATGRLNAAKSGHTATLLPNGKVLVVGQANSATDGAELYDPGTGTWSLTSSGPDIWRDHTATLLQTGKVLVVGGWSHPYGSYSSAALYEPASGSWSSTGRLTTGRGASHQATLLNDGRVLVTGGTSDADFAFGLPDAEMYDPVAGTWSRVPDLLVPRFGHSATLLPDGKVLIAGGDSLQSYPPAGTLWPNNNSSELFDPANGNWSRPGNLNTGRYGHTASLLPNGEVLVAGGYSYAPPGPSGFTPSAERYDASSGLWRDTGDLNTARYGHTATLLPNGKVLVAGGVSSGGILSSAELYDGALSPGAIGPDFTGSWYDPEQSGHGLFIEILPDNRLLAGWLTFNPAGTEQAWFLGTGTYNGNTAIIAEVVQPTGGRWIPNFDPSRIVSNSWGTLTFTFTDRDHGKVEFSSVSGYGTGSMNLARLTEPARSSASPPATIGPDFTGSWYDPEQSGHGLFIEVLPDNRLLAAWLTFNPAGTEQAWILGAGTYSGNAATITGVVQPTGGSWIPNFDPSRIVNNLWGTLTFTFADCNHGRVDFNSVLGYGAGSMNLTRLTQPTGVTCS